jgi:hypothetical protein
LETVPQSHARRIRSRIREVDTETQTETKASYISDGIRGAIVTEEIYQFCTIEKEMLAVIFFLETDIEQVSEPPTCRRDVQV